MGISEDGYRGQDILTLAQQLVDKYGDQFIGEDKLEERRRVFREEGLAYELAKLKKDLSDFRVNFDTWFSEQTLYDDNKVLPTLDVMKKVVVSLKKVEQLGLNQLNLAMIKTVC